MAMINPEKIYDILMEALGDRNVRDAVTEIITLRSESDCPDGQTVLFPVNDESEINSSLRSENKRLSLKLAESEADIALLKKKLSDTEAVCGRYRDALSSYYNAFAAQIAMYEKYRKLSEQTRSTLSGIFKNDSVSGLFFCGVQYDNLCSLRSFIEHRIINGVFDEDSAPLAELYAYLLSCYNSTFSEPVYALTSYAVSDPYDDELHHSLNGRKSGSLEEILLQGIVSVKNGKVIRKALVNAE